MLKLICRHNIDEIFDMRRIAIILTIIVWFVHPAGIMAQGGFTREKAVFIYNFSREVGWPENNLGNDFVVAVLGADDLYSELAGYATGKSISGRRIVVRKVENPGEAVHCQVLYMGSTSFKELAGMAGRLNDENTLVITDKRGAIWNGAGICFAVVNDRLQYGVSPENIRKAGLKYTSNLVDLAVDIPYSQR